MQLVPLIEELAEQKAFSAGWNGASQKNRKLMARTLQPCEAQRFQGSMWNFRPYNRGA